MASSTASPLSRSAVCSTSVTSATSWRRSSGAGLKSTRPASILDRSSTSLISCSRWRPLRAMWPRYSCRRGDPAGTMPACISSAKPMMALSGVRSSCDMLATNWLFRRLASRIWLVLGLQLARPLAGALAFVQGRLDLAPRSDVARDLGPAHDAAGGVAQRRDGDRHLHAATVAGQSHGVERGHGVAVGQVGQHAHLFGLALGRDQALHGHADGLVGGVAEQHRGRGVPAGDAAVQRLGDDGVAAGFHHRGQAPAVRTRPGSHASCRGTPAPARARCRRRPASAWTAPRWGVSVPTQPRAHQAR